MNWPLVWDIVVAYLLARIIHSCLRAFVEIIVDRRRRKKQTQFDSQLMSNMQMARREAGVGIKGMDQGGYAKGRPQ